MPRNTVNACGEWLICGSGDDNQYCQNEKSKPHEIDNQTSIEPHCARYSYDGTTYCFGKGKSATTVSAPDVAVANGTQVVLKGTVMDLSPAQPGTPCVSKDTMKTQMEYLHMQRPIDGLYHNETITGVPVTLTAIESDGTVIDIGTATTNGYYGTFTQAWTPKDLGTYTIMASFSGTIRMAAHPPRLD